MDSGGVTALLEASTWLLSRAGGSSQHVPRNVAGSDDEMLKKSQGEIAMMGLDRWNNKLFTISYHDVPISIHPSTTALVARPGATSRFRPYGEWNWNGRGRVVMEVPSGHRCFKTRSGFDDHDFMISPEDSRFPYDNIRTAPYLIPSIKAIAHEFSSIFQLLFRRHPVHVGTNPIKKHTGSLANVSGGTVIFCPDIPTWKDVYIHRQIDCLGKIFW